MQNTSAAYTFEQLTSADVSRMKDLLDVLGKAFDDIDTYQTAIPNDAYLSRLLDKPHVIALAATSGDAVVGGLVAYILDKFEQDRREMYIYDLAVLEPHRRKGIATGLINRLRGIAAALDVYVIFVQADRVDGPAIALYESLGTREDVYHFDINVRRTP
jgi:aminoglycoside 3-N-acetyltransferase I